jgi:predicted MPP superfamily phosphohydrolase
LRDALLLTLWLASLLVPGLLSLADAARATAEAVPSRAAQVYVSRGTGYWGPPKRFGAPSEITRVRLIAAELKTAEVRRA